MKHILTRTGVLFCLMCVLFLATDMTEVHAVVYGKGTVSPENCVVECTQGEPIEPFRFTLTNPDGYKFKKNPILSTSTDYANMFVVDSFAANPVGLSNCGLKVSYIECTQDSVTFEVSGTPTAPLEESMTVQMSLGTTDFYTNDSPKGGVKWNKILTVKITAAPVTPDPVEPTPVEPIPATPTPVTSTAVTSTAAPQTGDSSMPLFWTGGVLLSFTSVIFLLIVKRKKDALQ